MCGDCYRVLGVEFGDDGAESGAGECVSEDILDVGESEDGTAVREPLMTAISRCGSAMPGVEDIDQVVGQLLNRKVFAQYEQAEQLVDRQAMQRCYRAKGLLEPIVECLESLQVNIT